MKKILSLIALTAISSHLAHADPVAKLCRGSTVLDSAYREFSTLSAPKKKQACFHLGRITGQILENMTFKQNARKNLIPELLAMADEMVDRAVPLKSFCGGPLVDGKLERAVPENDSDGLKRQLQAMFGEHGLNARIQSSTCPATPKKH